MRLYDIGGDDGPEVVSDRVLTVPNVLSLLRLLVLPVIYWDLANGRFLRGFVVLAVFAASDWFDGYLARRLDQVTRLGKLLDPISDRLLVAVVGIAMIVADLIPWWAIVLLIARDVILLAGGAVLLAGGTPPPPVTRIGKTATFGLMFALPAFLLAAIVGDGAQDPNTPLLVVAWVTFAVNALLYYVAGVQYARTVLRERAQRPPGAEQAATTERSPEASAGDLH